jgi:hypothetical protein
MLNEPRVQGNSADTGSNDLGMDELTSHQAKVEKMETPPNRSRRAFLAKMGGAAAALGFTDSLQADTGDKLLPYAEGRPAPLRGDQKTTWKPGKNRGTKAYNIRVRAAAPLKNAWVPGHPDNGDEQLYDNRIGSFSKGMPHNLLGEVDPIAYDTYIQALKNGKPDAFDTIPQGGTLKFTSPQACNTFQLEGKDSHFLVMPPAPAFASAEEASEMAEAYWHALLRDVPFTLYPTHPLVMEACEDLSSFSDFRGLKSNGVVVPDTLFRGTWPGCEAGPYVSQFLLLNFSNGSSPTDQRSRVRLPGVDFMRNYNEWLNIQRGVAPTGTAVFDPTYRFLRTGRDTASWVYSDYPFQAGLHAGLILLGFGAAALADSNPYKFSHNQDGFATWGPPDLLGIMAHVSSFCMRACWFQKWHVHRRLRPETFGGRVHNYLVGNSNYPIHSDMLESTALDRIFSSSGTYLLPQAFPEGSPAHTSYPSGHATFIGASVTILKALFNEDFVIPQPVVPTTDGLALVPFNEEPLTVGGELNKLAANIGIARNFAGIHWRSDMAEGNKLGEAVAIRYLKEAKTCYNERFAGYTLTKFDGTKITI